MTSNLKNKEDLFSLTLKVGKNQVSLFFIIGGQMDETHWVTAIPSIEPYIKRYLCSKIGGSRVNLYICQISKCHPILEMGGSDNWDTLPWKKKFNIMYILGHPILYWPSVTEMCNYRIYFGNTDICTVLGSQSCWESGVFFSARVSYPRKYLICQVWMVFSCMSTDL